MEPKRTTLVFLRDDARRVLLAKKLRGFGAGKFNGFGGKILEGESAAEAACREVREECGVVLRSNDLREVADCKFYFESGLRVFNLSYVAERWEGEPHESDEMGEFQWCHPDELPFERMWQDDRLWLPQVLAGRYVRAEFWFAPDDETIARHEIELLQKN